MEGIEKYLVLYPDGSMRWLSTDRVNLCESFRNAIGCMSLEHVPMPYGFGCVVDDSGKINGQRYNPLASRLYPGTLFGDPLFGPVIFVRDGLFDGEPDWVPLVDLHLRIIEQITGKQVPD